MFQVSRQPTFGCKVKIGKDFVPIVARQLKMNKALYLKFIFLKICILLAINMKKIKLLLIICNQCGKKPILL